MSSPLNWIKDIINCNELDFEGISIADYNSILANLFLYEDKELSKLAFKLL